MRPLRYTPCHPHRTGMLKKRGAVVPVTVNPVLVTRYPVPCTIYPIPATLTLHLLPVFYVPIAVHPVPVTRCHVPVTAYPMIPDARYPVADTFSLPCTC